MYKKFLFEKQNGMCALTGLALSEVNKSHLDHDHALDGPNTGKCRGLLLAQANVLEGRIKHQFKRSGLDGKIDYIVFLKKLISYLEKDYTNNPTHPQLIPDLKKKFARLSLKEQRIILKDCDTTGKTKKELETIYSKQIKAKYESNKLNWKILTKDSKTREGISDSSSVISPDL